MQVNVSFAEVRNSQDLVGNVQNSTESEEDKLIKRVNYFRSFRKTRKSKSLVEPLMSGDSDKSIIITTTTTTTSSVPCNLEHSSSKPEFKSPTGSDSPPNPVKKSGFLSWKRRLSFNPMRHKLVPLIQNTNRGGKKVKEIDGSVFVGSIEVL